MSNLFSPEYAKLQALFHAARADYGTSGRLYSEQILQMANRLQTRRILDYGCGKCTLQSSLPFPIQNYDPFIPEYAAMPHDADIVVCTDVMEHVEEEHVDGVLEHIESLCNKAAFFQIATGPASKTLPDGRNAHITQHNGNWWLAELMRWFDIKSFVIMPTGFICVVSPFEGTVSPTVEP